MKNGFLNFLNYSLLGLFLLFCPGCEWFGKRQERQDLYNGLKLVNVNDEESFLDARIAGSINLTFDKVGILTKDWNKLDEIIVYCTNYLCVESDRIAKELNDLGFKNVKVYKGGIQEWYQLHTKDKENFPFEGKAEQPFLKKPIQKIAIDNQEIQTIDASSLSKRLKEARK